MTKQNREGLPRLCVERFLAFFGKAPLPAAPID